MRRQKKTLGQMMAENEKKVLAMTDAELDAFLADRTDDGAGHGRCCDVVISDPMARDSLRQRIESLGYRADDHADTTTLYVTRQGDPERACETCGEPSGDERRHVECR